MGWLCLRRKRDPQRLEVSAIPINLQVSETCHEDIEILGTASSLHGAYFCHLVSGATTTPNAGI